MKSVYDVVVVGAGPAGSVAARRAAETGLSVLLIEKRREIGAPVRCAEAVSHPGTEVFIQLDERWIDARVDSYAVHNSVGDYVIVPPTEPTLVLNRKVFDFELAALASKMGAEVVTNAAATDVLREDNGITGVRIQHAGRAYTVRARLVVAADGTESQVARWAGLKTIPPLADYYTGVQYLLGGIKRSFGRNVCEYHIGQSIAPGGYIWVFPKGEDRANVGIVVNDECPKDETPRDYLQRFVDKHYPEASILTVIAGGIPVTGAIRKMVMDGLVVVGDAAHQADPLTAGGINLGMIGADLALKVAIPALQNGDVSAKTLSEYERLWHQQFGKMHSALYRVRKILNDMPEDGLNDLIASAAKLPLNEMSQAQILRALFKARPKLLVEAMTLVATGLVMK